MIPAKRLKLFSDRNYIPEGKSHVTMLIPFWGKHREELETLQNRRYNRYAEVGESFFELTPLEQADFDVMPTDWEPTVHTEYLLYQLAERAERAAKSVMILIMR